MFDIAAIGETLIDFTPSGFNDMGMMQFARNPGGAPANVLAMASKLGGKTAFIGKVGDDDFGLFLKSSLLGVGIDVSGLSVSKEYNTTLAFVSLTESGDRSFTFYRKTGADIFLSPDDVDETVLRNCSIFHFSSVSLTDEPSRGATLYAVKKARDLGAVISFDPNYRPLLWSNEDAALNEIRNAIPHADIIKVSEEELKLLTETSDLLKGAKILCGFGPKLVLITLGSEGAFYYNGRCNGHLPAYNVETIDTTGAGDAFLGAVLHSLKGKKADDLCNLSQDELNRIIAFGNAAGSLATTKKGAIPSMPTKEEIINCIENVPGLETSEKSYV
jgi:Sugar kinases, ribokinase family